MRNGLFEAPEKVSVNVVQCETWDVNIYLKSINLYPEIFPGLKSNSPASTLDGDENDLTITV